MSNNQTIPRETRESTPVEIGNSRSSKQESPASRPGSFNERQIQNSLYTHILRKAKLACPNYTAAGWWEADLWSLSTAGYSTEYEVKCSRRDFRIDQLKTGDRWEAYRAKREGRPLLTKHQRLEAHDRLGPSRFYFVCPQDLLKEEEIPVWAGWIEMRQTARWLTPSIRKVAPQLHRQKVEAKVIDHCRSVFYYRYWNLREKVWPCGTASAGQTLLDPEIK